MGTMGHLTSDVLEGGTSRSGRLVGIFGIYRGNTSLLPPLYGYPIISKSEMGDERGV